MDDIEDLREQKKQEIRQNEDKDDNNKHEKREFLTSEARRRLNSFKMANQELGEEIEENLIHLHKAGRINRLDGEEMAALLKRFKKENSTDYDIKRR